MGNPLKLLDFYDQKDADIFFGRDKELAGLLEIIDESPIAVLTGESGSGKTSLLLAGVLARLANKKAHYERPQNLKAAKIKKLGSPKTKGSASTLLIIDQFEDILVAPPQRYEWLREVVQSTVKEENSLKIVFAMRSDYLSLFLEWLKPVRATFRSSQFFYLQRFDLDSARSILSSMLKAKGVKLSHLAMGEVIAALGSIDADDKVYPPHLQIVANHICAKSAAPTPINPITPKEMGLDIENILTSYFDSELFKGLNSEEETIAREIFDVLVGREGLRRKLTIPEIGRKIRRDEGTLQRLITLLIDRRALRHTENDEFELIHDFLSKHFFETFSAGKRELRKLQDMFHWLYRDYSESGILMDENRLRIILHYSKELIRNQEEALFLVKSILSQIEPFTFMAETSINLEMRPLLFQICEELKHDPEERRKIYAGLKDTNGGDITKELISLADAENEYDLLTDLLDLIHPFEPRYVIKRVTSVMESFDHIAQPPQKEEELDRFFSSLGAFHELTSEECLDAICKVIDSVSIAPLIENAMNQLIKSKTFRGAQLYVEYFQKLYPKISLRASSGFLDILEDLDAYPKGHPQVESLTNKMKEIVSNLFQKASGGYDFNWKLYFKLLSPDAAHCNSILEGNANSERFNSILESMAAYPRLEYLPLLYKIIDTEKSIESLNLAILSLRPYLMEEAREGKTQILERLRRVRAKIKDTEVLNAIDSLIEETESNRPLPFFQSFYYFPLGGDLPEIAGKKQLMQEEEKSTSDKIKANDPELAALQARVLELYEAGQEVTASILDVVNQPNFLLAHKRKALTTLWDKNMKDEVRLKLASLLLEYGSEASASWLLDKLARPEQLHKPQSRSLFSFNALSQEPAADIFSAATYAVELPEKEAFQKYILSYARRSGVPGIALPAFLAYAYSFRDDPQFGAVMKEFLEQGRFIGQRAIAAVSLGAAPGLKTDDTFQLLLDLALSSPFLEVREFAIAGLAAFNPPDLSAAQKRERLLCLEKIAVASNRFETKVHAVEFLASICPKKEIFVLRDIRRQVHAQKELPDFKLQEFTNKIDEATELVQNFSLEDRSLFEYHNSPTPFPALGNAYILRAMSPYKLHLNGMKTRYSILTQKKPEPIP